MADKNNQPNWQEMGYDGNGRALAPSKPGVQFISNDTMANDNTNAPEHTEHMDVIKSGNGYGEFDPRHKGFTKPKADGGGNFEGERKEYNPLDVANPENNPHRGTEKKDFN